jgi:isopentenyldiphosphate isomerase
MVESLVQVVDENDRPIAGATKQELWTQGLIHRIVRVIVEDAQGRILLQKRAAHKQPFPNRWDLSASGHVDVGEEYEQAALRELHEELGLSKVMLTLVSEYRTDRMHEWRRLNRFNRVYKTQVDGSIPITTEDTDIAEVRWFTRAELASLIATSSDTVTDGLTRVYNSYYRA